MQIRQILLAEPTVEEVQWLTGRNAGRFRFVETGVVIRVSDLRRAHSITQRLEQAVRKQVPHVERIVIHYEPVARSHIRYAVPLADPDGRVSEHFGEAPYFGLVTVRLTDGSIEKQEVVPNPHQHVEKAKGIRVAEWLVAHKVDSVLVKESLSGKGPEYVFANAGVEMHSLTGDTLSAALAVAQPDKE